MATKNSMANYHLSEAATKGRYGDDVLVHMNRKEVKSLANAAGLKDLPRNPETGLSEAWVFLAAGLALSLYQGAKATSMGRDAAKSQLGLLHDQKKNLSQQKETAGESVTAQKQAATAKFEMNLENLSSKTGMEKEDIMAGYDKAVQSSGMATTAGATESKEKMWDRVAQSFDRGQDSLYAQFGSEMGDIDGMQEEEMARIKAEEQSIRAQERLQQLSRHETFFGF